MPLSNTALRQHGISSTTSQQSNILATRVESKRNELEQLRQLRDLSHALAEQMQILEHKIGTLQGGAEAVACVLANWENILQAISMASSKFPSKAAEKTVPDLESHPPNSLPATLVRIPSDGVSQHARQ